MTDESTLVRTRVQQNHEGLLLDVTLEKPGEDPVELLSTYWFHSELSLEFIERLSEDPDVELLPEDGVLLDHTAALPTN